MLAQVQARLRLARPWAALWAASRAASQLPLQVRLRQDNLCLVTNPVC